MIRTSMLKKHHWLDGCEVANKSSLNWQQLTAERNKGMPVNTSLNVDKEAFKKLLIVITVNMILE